MYVFLVKDECLMISTYEVTKISVPVYVVFVTPIPLPCVFRK